MGHRRHREPLRHHGHGDRRAPVTSEGELTVGARMPIVGTLSHETHVVLEGAALNGPEPTFSVSAGSAGD
jgi:hypothetical protein